MVHWLNLQINSIHSMQVTCNLTSLLLACLFKTSSSLIDTLHWWILMNQQPRITLASEVIQDNNNNNSTSSRGSKNNNNHLPVGNWHDQKERKIISCDSCFKIVVCCSYFRCDCCCFCNLKIPPGTHLILISRRIKQTNLISIYGRWYNMRATNADGSINATTTTAIWLVFYIYIWVIYNQSIKKFLASRG